jgi:hypothetical protein
MSSSHTVKLPMAVHSAYEIVRLWESHQDALAEIERLRDYERKYHELLAESVQHGEKMMLGWMDLLMSDRVKLVPLTDDQRLEEKP